VKDPNLSAQRLLLVQPLTPEGSPTGKRLVVTDAVGSGSAELVYCCRGKESSFPFLPAEVPTDCTVVGIVDELSIDRSQRNYADRPSDR